jgi:flagellin-like protein
MQKLCVWSNNKRALSPIFATVLLAAIVISFGSVAYYYATNLTRSAANNYSGVLSDSQQAVGERLGFENILYTSSLPAHLTVYIINSGIANNIQLNTAFIYDSSHSIVGAYSVSGGSISSLRSIDSTMPSPSPISSLNVVKEACFTITLGKDALGNDISLTSGAIYTIHLITKSGSVFEYEFTP